VAGGVLLIVSRAAEHLEETGAFDTYDRDLDVQHVVEPLFRTDGDDIVTSEYGARTMVRSRFPVDKGDAFRLFVVGGSFAMGEPYVSQDLPGAAGGIPDYLRSALGTWSQRPTEVINAAAGGQDSNRVAAIVSEVAQHDPDALLVMTCNNEGALPPSTVRRALVKQGGFRLLRAALTDRSAPAWFSAQHPDASAVREAFRENLRSIVRDGGAAGATVYLATLPVHLEYRGFTLGHLLGRAGRGSGGHKASRGPEIDLSALTREPAALPPGWEGLPPCVAGIQLAEAGGLAKARPFLETCLADEVKAGDVEAIRAVPALAMAHLAGGDARAAKEILSRYLDPCVVEGVAAVAQGRFETAATQLARCDADLEEAIRWSGLAQLGLGHTDEGRSLLLQALELVPRNRCRPSFNRVIREVAAESDEVVLVDLDEAFQALPPRSAEQPRFLDSCHMDWRGYAELGAVVFAALRSHEEQLLRDGDGPDVDWFRREYELIDGPVLAQWPWMMQRTGRY